MKTDKDQVMNLVQETISSPDFALPASAHAHSADLTQRMIDLEETVQFILRYLVIMYVPKSQRVEGDEVMDYDDPNYNHPTLNERLDDVWKEVEELMSQFNQSTAGMDSKKLDDQERFVKILADHVEDVKIKVELFENEAKRKEKLFLELQSNVSDMMFSKAEKEEMLILLEEKCDKKDLDLKVSKTEFLATVEDLGESIETLVDKLQSNDEEWRSEVSKINKELLLKLGTEDYHTLQVPIRNRIRALMYGFKKMKSVIHSTLYPDASGITKCVSCGRPAELAGSKCKPSGDANFQQLNQTPSPSEKMDSTDDLAPLNPDDDTGENEKSFVSLPTESLKEIDDVIESGHSVAGKEDGTGLRKRKPKRDIDDEFDKLMATSTKTRFCGGAHTRTDPQQRGIHFTDVEIPPVAKENVNLVGYDNTTWYKGATPIEKIGELEYDVDPDTVDVDELMKACYTPFPDPPPRDIKTPRYCGGAHTLIDPLQSGLQFAPFRIQPNPLREEVNLLGKDGKVYKGVHHGSQPDIDDLRAVVLNGSKSRQTLHPTIVTLQCGNDPSQLFTRNQAQSSDVQKKKDVKKSKQSFPGTSRAAKDSENK